MNQTQTLDQLVRDLKPSEPIRRFISCLSADRNVEGRRRADYISLSPQPLGAVAVYCHTNRVSIAVEPQKAATREGAMSYASFRKKTPATTYVIVSETDLEKYFNTVLDLAKGAVEWRALGPQLTGRRAGRGVRAEKEPDICPTCWYEITPADTCYCD